MNNFLGEIIGLKKRRLEIAKAKTQFSDLKKNALAARERFAPHALRSALTRNDKINIIAEIKRASPSKGIINDKIDVAEAARTYEKAGACAVSVLTEEDKFKGSLDDLRKARAAIRLPLLRKDFIFDEFQIYEAAEAGADAVLLIAAMLDDEKLVSLYHLSEKVLGLDALIEVHDVNEMKRAEKLGAKIIGVNNRDLNSFNVSLKTSRELIKYSPKDALMISESGLKTREDLLDLQDLGFKGFLIGEALMRSENVLEDLQNLL
jgi:indole-3-glycerol phosphate synthase